MALWISTIARETYQGVVWAWPARSLLLRLTMVAGCAGIAIGFKALLDITRDLGLPDAELVAIAERQAELRNFIRKHYICI